MDFKGLKFDISIIPKNELVIDKYPELCEYTEFNDPKNDQLLRIAFLATDEGSPFIKKYRDDYENRIRAIFDYLNIKNNGLLDEILINQNYNYNAIVNRFFILSDNLAYVMWSNMLFNFHMIGIALRNPPDMDNMTAEMANRAKLQAQQKDIHADLVKYESEIFTDKVTRKIARKEIAKILQLPERFAQEKSRV